MMGEKMGPLENVIKKENMLPEAEDRDSGNMGSGSPVVTSATSGVSCPRCPALEMSGVLPAGELLIYCI